MTKEEKELLLKDLCARLPYGVKCSYPYGVDTLQSIDLEDMSLTFDSVDDNYYELDRNIKPYLRPLSSMAEEEYKEFNNIRTEHALKCLQLSSKESFELGMRLQQEELSYLYQRHYDVCGLIPKGLALEANEGIYI